MKNLLFTLGILVPLVLNGVGFNSAAESAEKDLKDALQRLSVLRSQIRDQKIPLSKELNRMNAELRVKRRDVERIQRVRDSMSINLNNLDNNVKLRRSNVDYMSNLLGEYARSFEFRMSISERQFYDSDIERFKKITGDPDLPKNKKLVSQLTIPSTALERVDRLIGGFSFEGKAVLPSGVFENGSFTLIGPVGLFASKQSPIAGLAENSGSLDPAVIPVGELEDAAIRILVESGKGDTPLDPTLGDARAIAETKETLIEHIQKGGIWIYPILVFAGLATLTALFKVIEIYSVKLPPAGTLHTVLKMLDEGKEEEAANYARNIKGPAGKMLYDGVIHSDESRELVEEVMYERMLEVQPKLERLLPFIAVTAATSPLMGLLGTVTGMIHTFRLITIFGTGDAKSLSSGISEALVTTEFGLIVAIPALIMHALLMRRAQGVMANLERMAVAFVNGLTRKN